MTARGQSLPYSCRQAAASGKASRPGVAFGGVALLPHSRRGSGRRSELRSSCLPLRAAGSGRAGPGPVRRGRRGAARPGPARLSPPRHMAGPRGPGGEGAGTAAAAALAARRALIH